MLKWLTKGDKIIILLVLIFNSIPLFIPLIRAEDGMQDKKIMIRVDGELIREIPLKVDGKTRFEEFSFSVGDKEYHGKLETKDGKVRLQRLPKEITPKAIHADMGWISKEHQMIVALPVKLVITVEGEEDHEVDILSY